MYEKTIKLTDEEVTLFARQYGWTEKIEDGDKEVENPVSAESVVDEKLGEFINESIFAVKKSDYEKNKETELEALRPKIKFKG